MYIIMNNLGDTGRPSILILHIAARRRPIGSGAPHTARMKAYFHLRLYHSTSGNKEPMIKMTRGLLRRNVVPQSADKPKVKEGALGLQWTSKSLREWLRVLQE